MQRDPRMEAQMEALARGGGACAKAYFENRTLMDEAVAHARAGRHAECAQAVVSAAARFHRILLLRDDVSVVMRAINTLLAGDATHPQATWLLIAGMEGPLPLAKAYVRFKAAASAHPGDVHVLTGCGVLALYLAQERDGDEAAQLHRESLQ
jgi:hypothetical protein